MSDVVVRTDIKKMLLDKGVTQIRMAYDLGISFVRLNQFLNGWVTIKPAEEKRILDYLTE